ncbi:hypothetical protein FHG89_11330 [Micromonospora orduensis]|uniref:Glycosyltransferase family 39 protein n=2 Tax=Micromonospora orduensis TaxID=1420891 RepID=A0A5C4QV95_9ACTN|nr:hypothetical protein [Micromonospora orduensis]TNH29710.1 hypothetical protein FHG89_11330 [Micromonospora orduensis]
MSMPEAEAGTRAEGVAGDGDGPGPLGRWLRADRVRAVAVALIIVSVAWRAGLAARGWFSQDEFVIAAQVLDTRLDADYLLRTFNNHLMPGGLLVAWAMVRVAGFASWPWVLLLAFGQAAVGVALYRLLRDLLRPGWGLLIPLCLFVFSPLTLEVSSLWLVGLLVLPTQLALVLAVSAQVRYVRTGRLRHLVAVAFWVVFGLLFDTKALLIVPLLFLLTAFLFTSGRVWRSLMTTVRRHWPAWLVLGALSGAYLAFYLTRPARELDEPTSVGQVLTFLGDLVGDTVVPGLLGGPWRWTYAGDGPPLVDPYEIAKWLSWAVLLTLVVVTVRRRPSAGRAWLLLVCYLGLVAALFAVTRLGGPLGPLVGVIPRYVADVVLVAAICVGAALLGTKDADEDDVSAWPVPTVLREPGAFAVGLVSIIVLLASIGVGTLWSTARFGDNWSTKYGRDYLATAQAELAAAPPNTVFFDATVPERVVAGYFWPDNLQSHFFRPAERRPTFVELAERPSTFDESGRIRPVVVEGRKIVPGPVADCGHLAEGGRTTRIMMDGYLEEWPYVVHFGYLSSGDSTALFQLGDATREITLRRGLNEVFFLLEGAGDSVRITVATPGVGVCTKLITVGRAVPAP